MVVSNPCEYEDHTGLFLDPLTVMYPRTFDIQQNQTGASCKYHNLMIDLQNW